jgi:hypothetical protein
MESNMIQSVWIIVILATIFFPWGVCYLVPAYEQMLAATEFLLGNHMPFIIIQFYGGTNSEGCLPTSHSVQLQDRQIMVFCRQRTPP